MSYSLSELYFKIFSYDYFAVICKTISCFYIECCGPPDAVSYLKYVEKIGQLYSQLCLRLAVKVKAIKVMEKSDKSEILIELQDDFNFTNLSEEKKEEVIADLTDKFVHQQTVIAKVSLLYIHYCNYYF